MTSQTQASPSWRTRINNWQSDLRLLLFITATLSLFRLLLLAIFGSHMADNTGIGDIFAALLHGLRYDLASAATWVILTMLLRLIPWLGREGRAHRYMLKLLIPFTLLSGFSTLVFFKYFGNQLDQRALGVFYDNQTDLILTFWKEGHPILIIGAFVLLNIGMFKLSYRWLARPLSALFRPLLYLQKWPSKLLTGVALFLFLLVLARGGLDGPPLARIHAYKFSDSFLNRIVLNIHNSVRYVMQDKLNASAFSNLSDYWKGDIRSAVATVFPQQKTHQLQSLDKALHHEAKGSNTPPKHLFIVVMESQSGWPLYSRYSNLNLAPEIGKLAAKGHYFKHYISDNFSTIGNISAIVTSLPYIGLTLNHEDLGREPLPTSLAESFKKLGYKTRFYYGGGLSWQRIGSFIEGQGFEELYGFNHMNKDAEIMNGWKVHDRYIYRFVESVIANSDEPSLNVILTTSNHPPYEYDWESVGYRAPEKLPNTITDTGNKTLTKLGAYWYADHELGAFVERVESRWPESLFAITGDHISHIGVHFAKQEDILNYAVPLVLYGPKVLQGRSHPQDVSGTHIDLSATLVELSAPKGFHYYSLGQNLFDKSAGDYAISMSGIFNHQGFYPLDEAANLIDLKQHRTVPTPVQTFEHYNKARRGLVWYRVKEGAELPSETAAVH